MSGRGRYGSMVAAGRRKPDHPHKWSEPQRWGILDARMIKTCKVKNCHALKLLRHGDGQVWYDGQERRR